MAESAKKLHSALNAVYAYCTSKTQDVIFSKGKFRNKTALKFGEDTLKIVDEHKYLGCTCTCIFNYNGKFTILCTAAYTMLDVHCTMNGLLTTSIAFGYTTCELFDTMVTPLSI